jgi:hypothetical protein
MNRPPLQQKPAPRLFWSFWVLALALAGPAAAYYRGDETVPRDFRIDDEYFVDEEPLLPSLEKRDLIRTAPRLYWASAGSFTSSDLYNQHLLRVVYPVPGTPLRLRAEYAADRDFDGIYTRFLTGLAYAPGTRWAVEVFGQPNARKQYADLGAALDYAGDSARLRAEWIFPQFWYNNKNDEEGRHVRTPMALRLDGAVQLPRLPLELFARAFVDFPSETRSASDEYDFTYRSWKPVAGGIWTLDKTNRLWGEASFEQTRKIRAGFEPSDPEDFQTRRNAADARIEWSHAPSTGARHRTGFRWVRLDETNPHPNAPLRMPDVDHATHLLYHSRDIPLAGPWALRTGLYAAHVHHRETYPADPAENRRGGRFQGKIPLGLEHRGPTHGFLAGLSMQIDQPAFGGGYIQLHVLF